MNKVIKNASWIIACRIIQAVLALLVTMVSARYLGPANYGLVNYAASIVNFLKPVMQLGLNAILVKELIDRPEEEGLTLGTALTMNFVSAIVSIIGAVSFVSLVNPGERETLIVCALYSISLIFLALEMIQYWFQAHLLSKYASLTILLAYIVVSVYKLWLLITGKNVYWFSVSNSLDYLLIAAALLIIYKKLGGLPLAFSFTRGRDMLKKSVHYIIADLMVMVFAHTDKVMLKMMIGDAVTGYYSAAVACTTMTNFVFVAIMDSARPTILKSIQKSKEEFEKNYTLLNSIVIYLALLQSVAVTVLAGWMVRLFYGNSYTASVPILRLAVWYTTFSYIGSTRYIWVLAKNQQHLLWKVNLSGALLNVVLNTVLIPYFGAMGAAVASLLTQIFTNVVIGFIIRPLKENNILLLKSLNPLPLVQYGAAVLSQRNSH